MSKTAVGMVETVGLLAAYEAADVAVKSANVELIGYEISRGGMVVIKFSGDVGAVKSAVDAAAAAASRLGKVFSSDVIPRPHQDINKKMILSDDTVGCESDKNSVNNAEKSSKESQEIIEVKEDEEESPDVEEDDFDSEAEDNAEAEYSEENEEAEDYEEKAEEVDETEEVEEVDEKEDEEDEDICNLCGDPDCPRKKGELRTDCIHYDEIMGDDK